MTESPHHRLLQDTPKEKRLVLRHAWFTRGGPGVMLPSRGPVPSGDQAALNVAVTQDDRGTNRRPSPYTLSRSSRNCPPIPELHESPHPARMRAIAHGSLFVQRLADGSSSFDQGKCCFATIRDLGSFPERRIPIP
jgi:hypothetical protein